MIKIVLVCSAGMSTSMLVEKMKEEAKKRGIEADITAIAETAVKKNVDGADVLLLGPQVRYALTRFKQAYEPVGVAVDVIGMTDYGRMNGAGVLDTALALIAKSKGE